MVSEIGPFDIKTSNPYRHKPADGWTKVSDVEEVQAVVDEANNVTDNGVLSANSISVTALDGDGKPLDIDFKGSITSKLDNSVTLKPSMNSSLSSAWLNAAMKKDSIMDSLMKVPSWNKPIPGQVTESAYAAEAQYLQNKTPSNNGITFTAAELHYPLGMYGKFYNQLGNLSQNSENTLMAEYVYVYTDFFYSRDGGPSDKVFNSPTLRMDFFSGATGHGRCGGTSPTASWSQLHGVPHVPHQVRCDLPVGHTGYHSVYMKQTKQWLHFNSSTTPNVEKCYKQGVVVRGHEAVSVWCGLDDGHDDGHLSQVFPGMTGWRYEQFKASHQPKQEEHVEPTKMVMPQAMSLTIPTVSGPVSLGAVTLEIVQEHHHHEINNGFEWSTHSTQGETKVTVTNAEGPFKDWAETFLHSQDPWNDVLWAEGTSPLSMLYKAVEDNKEPEQPSKAKKPEPEEKPKVDKYDFSPTVTDFEKQKKAAQKQELRNQAQGIINNADRMPLGAFLFAQKVLAHFGES